ncbi:MAG: YEATS-associated helix-containing protein [Syntrophales bacterium]
MQEPTSASYIILIVVVMLISGALGGMVSALLSARDDRLFFILIIKHTLIGMVTALTVPLLLNLLSGDLLESGQTKPLKLLTLSSLCIVFSMFSTRLLERVYGSQLKVEGQYGQEVHKNTDQPDKIEEHAVKATPAGSPDRVKKPEHQSKILRELAVAEDAKLTLADLMKNTEISQKDFDETLSLLMAKGAVAQELSSGNKLKLVLTARGRQQLNKTSAN